MATVSRWLGDRPQYNDSDGHPLASGRLFFFTAGTLVKANTYTTSAGDVANSNPMTLDAAGRPQQMIFLDVSLTYDIKLCAAGADDPPSVAVWTEEDIVPLQPPIASVAYQAELVYSNLAGNPGRLPFAPGYISGLTWANNAGDPQDDIDIAPGACRDSLDAHNLILTATLTKRIDQTWAVGTAAGGLDGTETTPGTPDLSTWYYIHLIKRSDTGVVDALFSESATNPTMPTNYDYRRLIGAVYNSGAGNVDAVSVIETAGGGVHVLHSIVSVDINLSNTLTTSRRTDTIRVPTAFATFATVSATIMDASVALVNAYVYCPDASDQASQQTTALTILGGASAGTIGVIGSARIRTDAAGKIALRANTATVDSFALSTLSWEWSRR